MIIFDYFCIRYPKIKGDLAKQFTFWLSPGESNILEINEPNINGFNRLYSVIDGDWQVNAFAFPV